MSTWTRFEKEAKGISPIGEVYMYSDDGNGIEKELENGDYFVIIASSRVLYR